jgi:8-hydroxy-5-deazaflavin:NADPH oxidoreductase
MKIGILGAGAIGAQLAQKLDAAGHHVKLANSRGPETFAEAVAGTNIEAVEKEDVAGDRDVIILSLPFGKNREVAQLLTDLSDSTIVVDTSNYYPMRDGAIAEVDDGKPETVWTSEQLGRPLIKAWNALISQTLAEAGAERGTPGRIAIPIAGDDAAAKSVVADLVSTTGFDALDAGSLSDSWRFQPGSPAYCTELTSEKLQIALADAARDRIPVNRDIIMAGLAALEAWPSRAEVIANNRAKSA